MTPEDFRRIALDLPEAVEVGHMGHPDFRVGGRIFATLGYPDAGHGMANLSLEQQEALCHAEPETFRPVPGGWGRKGATLVRLPGARAKSVRMALSAAWQNLAPPRLWRHPPSSPRTKGGSARRRSRARPATKA